MNQWRVYQWWLVSAAVAACSLPDAAGAGRKDMQKVSFREVENGIRVELDGQLFCEYRTQGSPRPYFYPVIGPTGTNVTRHWPMQDGAAERHDHPHHRSLWYAHGNVNGHDFWHDASKGKGPRIEVAEILEMKGGESFGVLRVAHRWLAPDDQVVCTDQRTFVFQGNGSQRTLDFNVTIEASCGELTFGDTKEGTMAIRVAPTMRVNGPVAAGHLVNSAGERDGKTWGRRATWCDAYGPLGATTVGVAILDHPSNPRHPTWWHAREYGLLTANPFGLHHFEGKSRGAGNWVIPAGESRTFRYRFLFHHGDEVAARVQAAFVAYAADHPPGDIDRAEKR